MQRFTSLSARSLPRWVFEGCTLLWLLVSCSPKPQNPATPPSTAPPTLIGRIASIPPDRRFALIEGYGKWTSETGTILTTRGTDARTANLLVTGETLGHFAAADIQSGTLEVGDAVYSRHVPKPPADPPAPEEKPTNPAAPSNPPSPANPNEPELPSHSAPS